MKRAWLLGGCLFAAACAVPCEPKAGRVCVWAGTGELGFDGDGKDRRDSWLYWPLDVEIAPDGTPWLIDWNNHKLRKVVNDRLETVVGDFIGDGPVDESDLKAPGAPGLTVRLNHPTDLSFEPDGTLLFAAWHNHKLRRVGLEGRVTVVGGRNAGYAGDGLPVDGALFNQPKALVRNPQGDVYVLDQRNFRVRKLSGGVVTTVVGTGVAGFSGDDGPPERAQLDFEAGGNPEPSGALALDAKGNLYISDARNFRIRKVDFARGRIETIAGTGQKGFSGDGAAATAARLADVRDLEFGPDGRLYLADTDNHRVRAIDLGTGTIETVVGSGRLGSRGDGLAPLEVELNRPFGIAFDAAGHLFVSDTYNSRVLEVVP